MRDDLILLASTSRAKSQVLVNKYLHGYATLQFACEIEGGMILSYDAQEYEIQSGEWFFPAHPGPRIRFHAQTPGGTWFHRHLGFTGPLIEKWRAAGLWLEKPQLAPPGTDWGKRMDDMIWLSGQTQKWSHWQAINCLEAILLELASHRSQTTENPWLENVLENLENGTSNCAVLARNLGLSESALRRKFKQATGQTMQEWILNGKINAARALLSESDLPLKAIATKLGYANEYFFSRQFKQFVGVAPGTFRKSKLK